MARSRRSSMVPVKGKVVRQSLTSAIAWSALCGLGFVVGMFIVGNLLIFHWEKIIVDIDPDAMKFGVFGLGLVIFCPVIIWTCGRSLFVKRRLVIGADRLQIVESWNGTDTVALQIPFANIKDVEHEVTSTERRIGIDLRDPDDSATYIPNFDVHRSKDVLGRHFCLLGGYALGLAEIAKRIDSAMSKWKKDKSM